MESGPSGSEDSGSEGSGKELQFIPAGSPCPPGPQFRGVSVGAAAVTAEMTTVLHILPVLTSSIFASSGLVSIM